MEKVLKKFNDIVWGKKIIIFEKNLNNIVLGKLVFWLFMIP